MVSLIILPEDPGTWDELWETACASQIGLSKHFIVCVDIDRFYEPFRTMLDRAAKDCILHIKALKSYTFEILLKALLFDGLREVNLTILSMFLRENVPLLYDGHHSYTLLC